MDPYVAMALIVKNETHKIMDGAVQLFRRDNSGNWYARFSINGRQLKRTTKTSELTKAKATARKAYLDALSRVEAGKPLTSTPFRQVADDYLTHYDGLVRRGEKLSDDYKFNVLGKARRFFIPYFGETPIEEITSRHIDQYQDWRRAYWIDGPGKGGDIIDYKRGEKSIRRKAQYSVPSVSAQNRELGVLRQIFVHAVKQGWLPKDRIPEINYPRGKKARRATFEHYEIEKLLQHLDAQILEPKISQRERRGRIMFFAFVNIAALSGMRPIEIDNLRWRDVVGIKDKKTLEFADMLKMKLGEFDVRIYVRGKGKERRIIPLKSVAAVFSMLWDLWEHERGNPPRPSDPVLFNSDGSRMLRPKRKLARTLEELGILEDQEGRKRCFTSFRHYYITALLGAGNSFHDVAKNAGTSHQMIERHYWHADLEQRADKLQMI